MLQSRGARWMVFLVIGAAVAHHSVTLTQSESNSKGAYRRDKNWPQLPAEMQAKLCRQPSGDPRSLPFSCESAVDGILSDGHGNIWMLGRFDPPIIKVDAAGSLVKAFGHGIFGTYPNDASRLSTHGFCMDRDGNLWAGDRTGRAVHKFSQDGKHLMSVGKPDGAGVSPETLIAPVACAEAANGDMLIADGHVPRIVSESEGRSDCAVLQEREVHPGLRQDWERAGRVPWAARHGL